MRHEFANPEALKAKLRARFRVEPGGDIFGCFLCKWILEDLEVHGGAMTDGKDLRENGEKGPLFPMEAKLHHLKLEGLG